MLACLRGHVCVAVYPGCVASYPRECLTCLAIPCAYCTAVGRKPKTHILLINYQSRIADILTVVGLHWTFFVSEQSRANHMSGARAGEIPAQCSSEFTISRSPLRSCSTLSPLPISASLTLWCKVQNRDRNVWLSLETEQQLTIIIILIFVYLIADILHNLTLLTSTTQGRAI